MLEGVELKGQGVSATRTAELALFMGVSMGVLVLALFVLLVLGALAVLLRRGIGVQNAPLRLLLVLSLLAPPPLCVMLCVVFVSSMSHTVCVFSCACGRVLSLLQHTNTSTQ